MKPGRMPPERELPGLLDRLVCGELDELPRGRLLEWLDEDPLRWRACGLAFLEAQTWSQALGQWPLRELVTPSIPTREQPVAGAASSGADGGNAGRQNHDAARTEEPLLASLDVQAGGRFGVTAPIRIPVAPAGSNAGEDQTARRLAE